MCMKNQHIVEISVWALGLSVMDLIVDQMGPDWNVVSDDTYDVFSIGKLVCHQVRIITKSTEGTDRQSDNIVSISTQVQLPSYKNTMIQERSLHNYENC